MRRTLKTAVAAALAAAALAAGLAYGAPASPQACFPASKWDAKDSERPCARIVRVYEDGSVRIAVSDADGTPRFAVGVGAKDR